MPEDLNFDEELTAALDAKPFVPFTIVTASGDRYDVSNPRLVAYGGDVVIILRPRVGSVRLRIYNVTAIEIPETSS